VIFIHLFFKQKPCWCC